MSAQANNSKRLTRYPSGSFKELLFLALPLVLSTLSANMLNICDRYFLSLYSQSAWKAVTAATNITYFLQIVFVMIALVSQGFIGYFKGSNQEKKIGPFVWQMIYFSIFSMIITYPLGVAGEYYLKGIESQQGAILYLRYLSAANFLFPLGSTLSAFYLGRGKTQLILCTNIVLQAINVGLDYILIFGYKPILSPMGIKGAALATIVSQALFCTILFISFAQKKYKIIYSTNNKNLNIDMLFECLKAGLPRALGRCTVIGSWVLGSYFLIQKGGDYFLVYSFGVTIFTFTSFFMDGISQALVTLASYNLGKTSEEILQKNLKNALLLLSFVLLILFIPLILLKKTTISIFVKSTPSSYATLQLEYCCIWLWISSFCSGINRIGMSFITASRDTVFYAVFVFGLWFTFSLPIYIGVNLFACTPVIIFICDSFNSLFNGIIFMIRFLKSPYKKIERISEYAATN